MMAALRLLTESSTEPVSLAEIKLHLRLSTSDTTEDTLLNSYITASRRYAENYTKRALIPETWQLTLDAFPDGGIVLPRPPLATNSSDVTITYTDATGGAQTLASTAFVIDSDSEPAWVFEATASEWPDTNDAVNAVRIQYNCGYATAPEELKTWIKLRVGALYEHREAVVIGGRDMVQELPRAYVDGLLDGLVLLEV